jgi:hypothetical protein
MAPKTSSGSEEKTTGAEPADDGKRGAWHLRQGCSVTDAAILFIFNLAC